MSSENRKECLTLVAEARASGARSAKACDLLGVSVRTAERWATRPEDMRQGPKTKPAHTFTDEERRHILALANSLEFANLPPCQIVPLRIYGLRSRARSTIFICRWTSSLA